jgi:hypothetical protein
MTEVNTEIDYGSSQFAPIFQYYKLLSHITIALQEA